MAVPEPSSTTKACSGSSTPYGAAYSSPKSRGSTTWSVASSPAAPVRRQIS